MISDYYKCAQCAKGGMTEQQAINHECGVEEPEVVLAPEPVDHTLRLTEAVEALTYHVAKLAALLEFQVREGRHAA